MTILRFDNVSIQALSNALGIDVNIISSEGSTKDYLVTSTTSSSDTDDREHLRIPRPESQICVHVGHIYLKHYVGLQPPSRPAPAGGTVDAEDQVIDLVSDSEASEDLESHDPGGPGVASDADSEDLSSGQPRKVRSREQPRENSSPNKTKKKRQRRTGGVIHDHDALYNQTPSPAAAGATPRSMATITVTEVQPDRSPSGQQHAAWRRGDRGHPLSTGLSTGMTKLKLEYQGEADSEMKVAHLQGAPAPASPRSLLVSRRRSGGPVTVIDSPPAAPAPPLLRQVPGRPTVRGVTGGRFKLKRKDLIPDPTPRADVDAGAATGTPSPSVPGAGASANTASSAPALHRPSMGVSGLSSALARASASSHPSGGGGFPRRNLTTAFTSALAVASRTRGRSQEVDESYAGYSHDTEGFHFGDTVIDSSLDLVLGETTWYMSP